MAEVNIKVILEYDGSRYDGWQRQGNTEKTIQGKLEQVLERMAGGPVEVHGSGRTDAGVHALGQAANFHLPESCPVKEPGTILSYLNQYLPEDIAVLQAEIVSPRFHSRLNAISKTYLYRIEMAPKKSVFQRRYVYGLGRSLDVAAMEAAAEEMCIRDRYSGLDGFSGSGSGPGFQVVSESRKGGKNRRGDAEDLASKGSAAHGFLAFVCLGVSGSYGGQASGRGRVPSSFWTIFDWNFDCRLDSFCGAGKMGEKPDWESSFVYSGYMRRSYGMVFPV